MNRFLFRRCISEACDALPSANYGQIMREHGLAEFLQFERIERMNAKEFFVFAICELMLDGKTHNNCAIALAALEYLLERAGDPDDKWRDNFAFEVLQCLRSEDVKCELKKWVDYNF